MRKNPVTTKVPAEQVVKEIRRATRKPHSSEEKFRIVLSGLRGDDSIAELCHKKVSAACTSLISWVSEGLPLCHLTVGIDKRFSDGGWWGRARGAM